MIGGRLWRSHITRLSLMLYRSLLDIGLTKSIVPGRIGGIDLEMWFLEVSFRSRLSIGC